MMDGQRTDRLQGRKTLFRDCARYDNRIKRVRSVESLESILSSGNPLAASSVCQSILFVKLVRQLVELIPPESNLRKRHLWSRAGREFAAMPSSCKDIRAALAACLQESDCIMIQRNKPTDCLRQPLFDELPTKCQQLKKGYGECKRGMVDMRKRFRGNQPISFSKETEGGGSGGQLYAGKPAFGGTVTATSGNEPEARDWREMENERFRKEG